MLRRVAKIVAIAGVLIAGTLACCRIGLRFLPEKYAVNAPIGHLLLGRGTEAAPADEAATVDQPAPEPPPRPPFAAGDAVRVAHYGRGIVESVDGEGVTVRFGEGRARTFLADYVRPAIARARRRVAGPRVA